MLRLAVLQFSREVAFATAHVYASYAESRGAWDARLEALVVDALVRGERSEELPGRTAALGWATTAPVVVLVGRTPPDVDDLHSAVRRAARSMRAEVLVGVHADQLVVVLGGLADLPPVVERVSREFGPGPVVMRPGRGLPRPGPATPPPSPSPGCGPRAAWPGAPRPVAADDLLAERALDGDPLARAALRRAGRAAAGRPPAAACSTPCARCWPAGATWRPARGPSSCTPTPCGTGSSGPPSSPGCRPPTPAAAGRCRWPWPWPHLDGRPLALVLSVQWSPPPSHALPGCRRTIWRNPPKITGVLRGPPAARRTSATGTVGSVLAVLAPGQGAQKPGMLTDWLELPGAESFFRWAGAIADADLLELGTTGDAEAIKDTAVTQPLVVAMSLFVARELGGLPGPVAHTPQAGRDVVIAGHSVGELTAAVLAGVLTVEAAIALTAVRGRAMAAACAQTPTGMSAVLGGDPAEVLAAIEAHGLTPANRQRRRPGRRRRLARRAGRAQGRPAGQGPGHAAVGRRRVPHRVHGHGPHRSWRA